MKKILFLVGISLTLSISAGFLVKPNDRNNPDERVLLRILNYILSEGHYNPKDINDAFSANVFDRFVGQIDMGKRYFLNSDIEEFKMHEMLIDDEIKENKLTFFYKVYQRLAERIEESKTYYKEILAEELDFNGDVKIDLDYEKQPYAANKKELADVWKKQLMFDVISRYYDKIEAQNDSVEKAASYQIKPNKTLQKEAREASLQNMDDYYSRLDELEQADWFATYINSITEEFDPHTSYFDPSTKKNFDISMAGKLEGIGARLFKKNGYTKVSELVSGGPAWKQGDLEVGDLILRVAQGDEPPVDIVGMRLDKAIEYIKGKKGTRVKLTVKKIDGSINIIAIIRDVVEIEETFLKSTIVTLKDKKFAIIQLPKFYKDFNEAEGRDSAVDMEKEIKELKKEGVEGIVLDLRNNGGGSLDTAIDISGLFVGKGPVVQVKYRGMKEEVKNNEKLGVLWDKPLVVLVNENAASSSEIFAGAMQDYRRAVILGSSQTFGKGTVQSVLDLNKYHRLKNDLGALKLTIQKFYRITGNATQLEGVKSDIILPTRYKYLNIGEKDLENPLPFDKVSSTNYTLWDNYTNFDETINNSKNRIALNPYFMLVDENAKWLKKNQDDDEVSLNFEAYQSEIEDKLEEQKKFKGIREYDNGLEFKLPSYESMLANNEDFNEKRKRWHKNLKRDAYVEEALNVLSSLKVKQNVKWVKN